MVIQKLKFLSHKKQKRHDDKIKDIFNLDKQDIFFNSFMIVNALKYHKDYILTMDMNQRGTQPIFSSTYFKDRSFKCSNDQDVKVSLNSVCKHVQSIELSCSNLFINSKSCITCRKNDQSKTLRQKINQRLSSQKENIMLQNNMQKLTQKQKNQSNIHRMLFHSPLNYDKIQTKSKNQRKITKESNNSQIIKDKQFQKRQEKAQLKKLQKQKVLKQCKQNEAMKECTFKPKLTKYNPH